MDNLFSFVSASCVLFELILHGARIFFMVISRCFCFCLYSGSAPGNPGGRGDGRRNGMETSGVECGGVPETDYHQWATLLVSLDAVKAHGMEQKMLAMRCQKTLLYGSL